MPAEPGPPAAGGRAAPLLARVPMAAALLLACATVLAPVGGLLWASLRVEEVVTTAGVVHRPVGEVSERADGLSFAVQAAPGAPRVNVTVPYAAVAERRTRLGLDHHRIVLGDPRTGPLLASSLWLALGAALVALALGLPAAWALARVRLPASGLLHVLAALPLLLPPLVTGMGAARPVSRALSAALGLSGTALQRGTAQVILGAALAPLAVLLVGRAWAAVPAGPVEAARLLRGPAGAFRVAVLPALLRAAVGAGLLALLLALADFTVPDLMTFLLPDGGTPLAVFAKDVQLQWKQEHSTARAVATGTPLLLLCLGALLASLAAFRRSGLLAAARTGRTLAPERRSARVTALALLLVLLPVGLGLGVPLAGVLSWAGAGGSTVAGGSAGASRPASAQRARLFDLEGTLDRTPDARSQRDRWLRIGGVAAVLTVATASALARASLRGNGPVRLLTGLLATLSLASPGIVVGLGTLLTWQHVGPLRDGIALPVLALVGRFLPYALVGALLAFARVRPGYEEAAATLGAPPRARLARIALPLAAPGLLAAFVLTLLLALREVDAVVLLETRLFPLLIYDKIHYGRLADEANLALAYLGYLLGPALAFLALRALVRLLRGRRDVGPA